MKLLSFVIKINFIFSARMDFNTFPEGIKLFLSINPDNKRGLMTFINLATVLELVSASEVFGFVSAKICSKAHA